jgi:DNA-binding NarL/FixJ family response regulator
MVRIVLVDDHPIVLHGLRSVLQSVEDFEIVGEALSSAAGLELVKQQHPDLLVLDVVLPGIDGLELARQVQSAARDTRIVIFSLHASDVYVRTALSRGASAYVLKNSDASELVHAIREVMAGRRYLSKVLTERAVDAYLHAANETLAYPIEMLTTRESQVIQLVAAGKSNVDIAQQLGISPRTVETHRSNVMRKLGLKTHADLLRYAIQQQMINAEQ